MGIVGAAHPEELDWAQLESLLVQSKALGLEWIYTCGLGEPLEDPNFWNLLDFIRATGIGLSIFTNGVFIQNIATARRLKDAGVCIILKMDTFDEEKFDAILGERGIARQIYKARDLLLMAGYAHNANGSDLAFSIVPTALSADGIPAVVQYCEDHQIFASIGELEQAGEVMKDNARVLNDFGLSQEQIASLKSAADAYAGDNCYMRPICPSILTGIHIDYIGNALADRLTGLNCKWFLLSEPDVHIFGNIKSEKLKSLVDKAIAYRNVCFIDNADHIATCAETSYIFGGCGGNPKAIMELAKKHLGGTM